MPNHHKIMLYPGLLILFVSGLLASCATTPLHPINEEIKNIPALKNVRENVNTYIGRRIRWGGVIAKVSNEKTATVLEIVEHPLDKIAQPLDTDQTQGRFLARFNDFLDPVVYAKGREITIVGTINKETKQLINQYEYTYPEVTVDSFVLWKQVDKQTEYYYDPYWPHYYSPWYPRYGWPPYYPWRYY